MRIVVAAADGERRDDTINSDKNTKSITCKYFNASRGLFDVFTSASGHHSLPPGASPLLLMAASPPAGPGTSIPGRAFGRSIFSTLSAALAFKAPSSVLDPLPSGLSTGGTGTMAGPPSSAPLLRY